MKLDYEKASQYRENQGTYLRKNQWKDLNVEVYTVIQAIIPAIGESWQQGFCYGLQSVEGFGVFRVPKNEDARNNKPPAVRVRVDCYTKKLPFRLQ